MKILRHIATLLWIAGFATCHDASAQQGTLSSNSPCQLSTDQTTCSVQINWTTANSPISCLWLSDGRLFACGGGTTGSQSWNYTTVSGTEFVLRSHPDWDHVNINGAELARMTVTAQPPSPAPSGSLHSDSPCILGGGASSCSVTLNWSTSHSPISCIWTQSGSLFACSGNANDSAIWPYATTQSSVMILRSHPSWSQIDVSGQELARTNVWALAPNASPTVELVTPSEEGFAGHKLSSITLTASATDPDGFVQRVEYLADNEVIGSSNSGGNFTFTWHPSSSGEFTLAARVFDNAGASSTSGTRRVIVAEYGLPPLPATYGTADQYFPMFPSNMRTSFRGVSDPNGNPNFTWSIPASGEAWDFHWPQQRVAFNQDLDLGNTTWERWQRRSNCTNGSSWLYVNSYHQRTSIAWYPGVPESNHDTQIATTLALFDYQGRIYDITNVCGGIGQPYIPNSVTGQPMRIRAWGTIGGIAKWFWEAHQSYSPSVTNSCWQGSGSNTRPAILQAEGWWDQNFGWSDGGNGGGGSMNSAGVPNGLDVVMVRDGSVAYQAGYAWSIRAGAHLPVANQWQACSTNTVGYTFPNVSTNKK